VSTGSAYATTDSSGNYTITGLTDGTYTVAPDNTLNYVFNPTQKTVTINGANVTGINFGAYLPKPKLRGSQTSFYGAPPVSVGQSNSPSGSGATSLQPAGNGGNSTAGQTGGGLQVNRPSGGPGGPNARGGGEEVYYASEQSMETPTPKASMTVPPAPSGGTTRYYVEDHLGTVRLVTDEQGAVVEWHDYEPFGVEIAPSTNVAENTHQYTGQERDAATQMDYMHFRYYGSNLGRFMKPDNVMGTAMNPQDWNLYSYVHGNPVNFNDPTGHLGVDQHQFMLPSDSIAGSAYSMFENGHISTLPDGLGDAETDSMGDPGILADNRKISTNWPAWYASAAAQQAASNNSGYDSWVQTASNNSSSQGVISSMPDWMVMDFLQTGDIIPYQITGDAQVLGYMRQFIPILSETFYADPISGAEGGVDDNRVGSASGISGGYYILQLTTIFTFPGSRTRLWMALEQQINSAVPVPVYLARPYTLIDAPPGDKGRPLRPGSRYLWRYMGY